MKTETRNAARAAGGMSAVRAARPKSGFIAALVCAAIVCFAFALVAVWLSPRQEAKAAEITGITSIEALSAGAMEAAREDTTLTLGDDITADYTDVGGLLTLPEELTHKLTIDLNGHTLRVDTSDDRACLDVAYGVTLVVKNGTLAGSSNGSFAFVKSEANVTLENVTIEFDGADQPGSYVVWSNGYCTFDKVQINATGVEEYVNSHPHYVTYATLQDEINAATPGKTTTVELTADANENLVIPEDKNIILDLKGNKLTSDVEDVATIHNKGTLKIIDTAEVKGTITRGSTTYYVIRNDGVMTIADVNVENLTSDPSSLVANSPTGNGATLRIESGTFTSAGSNAVKNDPNGKIVIEDGTFSSASSSNAAVFNWAEVTINGGTFINREKSGKALFVGACNGDHNTTVVTGGTFEADSAVYMQNGDVDATKGTFELTIENGTFKGAVETVNYGFAVTEDDKLTVTGGTFEDKVAVGRTLQAAFSGGEYAQALDPEWYAADIVQYKTEDGKYGIGETVPDGADALVVIDNTYHNGYTSLTEALASAKSYTLTLYADIDEQIVAGEGVNKAIDLNGFDITYSGNGAVITNNGKLNIKDGTKSGVSCIYKASGSSGSVIVNNGTLTMSNNGYTVSTENSDALIVNNAGGTFQITLSSVATYFKANGTAIDNSGTFKITTADNAAVITADVALNNNGEATIKGGTFEGGITGTAEGFLSGGTFSAIVSESYLADGFALAESEDGYKVVDESGEEIADYGAALISEDSYVLYSDAIAAIDAAGEGDTVKLLEDVNGNITINANQSVTLDVNGKTITSDVKGVPTILNNGTLNIIDTAEVKGTITRGLTTYYVIRNDGVMTIADVNVENSTSDPSSLVANNSTYRQEDPAKLTITSGTFTSGASNAVKNDEYGVLEISDGVFETKSANHAAVQNWATATISGGTFTGVQFAISAEVYMAQANTTTISGGTFNAPNAVYISDGYTLVNDNGEETVYPGGTLNVEIGEAAVLKGAVTEAAEHPIDGSEGDGVKIEAAPADKKFTVSGEDMLRAALGVDGAVIDLAADIELKDSVQDGSADAALVIKDKNITINGNGYTLTADADRIFRIYGGDNSRTVTINGLKATADQRVLETRSGNLTLDLEGVTFETTGAGNTQVLTAGGTSEGQSNAVININGSTLKASTNGYAVITFNPVDLDITGSDLSGYAAVYMKPADSSLGSAGSEVTVTNSTLSNNGQQKGETDTFGVIVLQDSNIKVSVSASEIDVKGYNELPRQSAVHYNSSTGDISGNDVTLTDCTIASDGDYTLLTYGADDNKLTVDGGKSDFLVDSKYLAEGNTQVYTDGAYVIGTDEELAVYDAVAVVDSTSVMYTSLADALEAAPAGATVKLLGDATVNPSVTINKSITIDLGGFTVTNPGNSQVFVITADGVTIENGSLTGQKVISAANAENITLKNVTITGTSTGTGNFDEAVRIYNASVTLDGVTLDAQTIGVRTWEGGSVNVIGGSKLTSDYITLWALAGTSATVNDSTINAEGGAACYYAIYAQGEVNVTNSTLNSDYIAVETNNGATVVLDKATINVTYNNGMGIGIGTGENTSVTVKGSTINADDVTGGIGIQIYGAYDASKDPEKLQEAIDDAEGSKYTSLTVTGTKIDAYYSAVMGNGAQHGSFITIVDSELTSETTAIYHPQYGNMTLAGNTTVTGGTGIEMRAGTLTINDDTVSVTATADFAEQANGNGSTLLGVAIGVSQHSTNAPVNVAVGGGTFTANGNGGYAFYEVDLQDETTEGVTAALSGGTFEGAVESKNLTEFISGGKYKYAPAENAFAEGYAGVLYEGYYQVVSATTDDPIGLLAAISDAETDARMYAMAYGLSLGDIKALATGEDEIAVAAQSVLDAYAAMTEVTSENMLAIAKLAVVDAIDVLGEAVRADLASYKQDAIGRIDAAAAAGEGTTAVVVPTATYAAIMNAATKAEVDMYETNAMKEIADVRAFRAEIAAQTETLGELAGSLETLGTTIGGEFDQLLTDVRTAISEAKDAVLDGTSGQLSGVQTALEAKIDAVMSKLTDTAQSLAGSLETLGTTIGGEFDQLLTDVRTAISEAQTATGTAITGAVSSLTTKIEEVKTALNEAVTDLTGELGTLASNLESLGSTMGGEFDQLLTDVKTAIDTAKDAVNSSTADAISGAVSSLTTKIEEVKTALNEAVGQLEATLAGYNTQLAGYNTQLAGLTGALETAGEKLETAIADAQSDIDAIADKLDTLATGADADEIAAAIAAIKTTVDSIAANVDAASAVEEAKTDALTEIEDWLGAYLDDLLGTAQTSGCVTASAYTPETEDGELYDRLVDAFGKDNAALVLKYYNDALAAIDEAQTMSDVTTAVSTFKAQVASVESASGNAPGLAGVYVLLVIVLIVAAAAAVLLVLGIMKKQPAPAAPAPTADKPEEKKNEEIKEDRKEEEAAVETAAADSAEDDDDDRERVVISANVRTFDEAYAELPDESRELFDKVKNYALSKEGTREAKMSNGVCVKYGSKKVVRLTVRRGNPVAMFVLENEMLKDFRRTANSNAKLKIHETELVIREEADLDTAFKMVDITVEQIGKDIEAAKERRREARRARRARRAEDAAAENAADKQETDSPETAAEAEDKTDGAEDGKEE